jgi:hypothetical protein
MPDMFSDFMATFFANMMPYIVLMQAAAYCWFMVSLSGGRALKDYPDASENLNGISGFALVMALVCLICPWRTCIGARVAKSDVNAGNTSTYNDRVLFFQTDYDRENPLTKKQGESRILDLLLEEAKKGGDEQQVAALEQHKVEVGA